MEAYKLATNKERDDFLIIRLEIPENAITNINRKSIFNKSTAKHRANKAIVKDIYDFKNKKYDEAYSLFNPNFCYKLNELVTEESFNKNLEYVCTTGIHFFLEEYLARFYYLHQSNVLSDYCEDGLIHIYHENGALYQEFRLKESMYDGKVYEYDQNQKLKKVLEYKKGIRTDFVLEYN